MFHAKIQKAANVVLRGGVIAYPTEAVWGLGCDPYDESAVYRILDLKQRPVEKGLILVAANIDMCADILAHLSVLQREKIAAHTNKPVTWLVPGENVPYWIRGEHSSFALRITRHPWAAALTRAVGGPIVSTSANPAGRSEARNRLRLATYFAGGLDYIAPGMIGSARQPSEIRDLLTGEVLRPSI